MTISPRAALRNVHDRAMRQGGVGVRPARVVSVAADKRKESFDERMRQAMFG